MADLPQYDVVIIGSGPAGTFAALTLARAGIKCIIVERGEAVELQSLHPHGEKYLDRANC